MPTDLVATLEEQARRRFVRWDSALWARLVEGPARTLAASLRKTGQDDTKTSALLEVYLRLASEGIGLGYLFPGEAGQSFFGLAFMELLPAGLAAVPPESRARVLAQCWNLGENLEHASPWLRRVFLRLAAQGAPLDELAALVERVQREVLGEPAKRLGAPGDVEWIDLGVEDRRFLPGTLHFVAPTVVCVHQREGIEGLPTSTGVWLARPPMLLGPMSCDATPPAASDRLDLVETLGQRDARLADALNAAANPWRLAVTLDTSQFLIAAYPA